MGCVFRADWSQAGASRYVVIEELIYDDSVLMFENVHLEVMNDGFGCGTGGDYNFVLRNAVYHARDTSMGGGNGSLYCPEHEGSDVVQS